MNVTYVITEELGVHVTKDGLVYGLSMAQLSDTSMLGLCEWNTRAILFQEPITRSSVEFMDTWIHELLHAELGSGSDYEPEVTSVAREAAFMLWVTGGYLEDVGSEHHKRIGFGRKSATEEDDDISAMLTVTLFSHVLSKIMESWLSKPNRKFGREVAHSIAGALYVGGWRHRGV